MGARIKIARPVMPASELYQGRAFREACNLAKESGGGLFILSAGLGVIDWVKPIPSYSLTVSETSEDAIQARCIDKEFSPDRWWASLPGSSVQLILLMS